MASKLHRTRWRSVPRLSCPNFSCAGYLTIEKRWFSVYRPLSAKNQKNLCPFKRRSSSPFLSSICFAAILLRSRKRATTP
ncbi:hypothetical protein SODALDRAFT_18100 [Sodiomyces alkalinus F11]|uniref:Uncharacterized protein n=1 Tax=Sodiomyces alkalinus (strain CBS 110278 / VKM F-3762 / F11) TaxID=1314773 RepID=A0A3N2Q7A7_SODAK|nr:hypothetical protein SODALDRAFT_18100 [Sodiomyces alkalinus F11]ROT42548.1 hypothetical protein SODALDRAFT_18100 [Sodiomyces alkalinus F11]